MESTKHALVLTGEVQHGFSATEVWPAVAAYFRIDRAKLDADVLVRAPVTIKESDDLADLERRRQALTDIGACSEVFALTGGSYFVLIDNVPRGPLPRAYIDQRMGEGGWPAPLKVAAVGSSAWHILEPAAGSAVPPGIPPLEPLPAESVDDTDSVDEADTVAAKIARVADSIASRKDPLPLPPGNAIHAGFWRRCAAWLIDNLLLFIPSFIVMLIPILGVIVYFVGRWAYFAMMESSPAQATLGKRAMGIIATDGRGQRLSLGQASGRYFAGALSYITLQIGYALAGWTRRKQALHDLIADTCVVFDTVRPGEPMPTERPPMPWYGWVANVLFLLIFPVAILAAIALPAYQQYVVRARVASVMVEAESAKLEVAEQMLNGEACPSQMRKSDNPLIGSFSSGGKAPDCLLTMTFSVDSGTPAALRGLAIEWRYSQSGEWTCSSAIDARNLPASCRP